MTQQRNDVIKTPTSILFDKADNFQVFFWYKAPKKYAQLAEEKTVNRTTKVMTTRQKTKIKLKKTALKNGFISED